MLGWCVQDHDDAIHPCTCLHAGLISQHMGLALVYKRPTVPVPMAAVLDIEGTICPITFVKDTLFPYFLEQAPNWAKEVEYPISAQNATSEAARVLCGFPEDVVVSEQALLCHIRDLVARDVKDPVLKAFQGLVWRTGYDNGDLVASLYADAVDFIVSRPAVFKDVYIYSSGSVAAQKLLLAHVRTAAGVEDLTPHLSGYFDITTAGHKQEKASYSSIVHKIGVSAEETVFFSDNVAEVRAALAAGLRAFVVDKPGNAPLSEGDREELTVIKSLTDAQV